MVESLEPLRRLGRIGRAQELICTLVDAHSIITFAHGEAAPVETVRPRRRALFRLRQLTQAAGAIETLLVCATSVEATTQMKALLTEGYAGTIQMTCLGPTNGANLGPAIAVA